jgi:hypothetical protein
MSVCDIYFKSKIPLHLAHLVKEVTKEELIENIYKLFPTLVITDEEKKSLFNLSKTLSICIKENIFKVTDS